MFRSRPKLSSAYDGRVFADSEVSVPAALIGEPARAAMLVALLDGRSRPAGELARTAGVSAGTASEHLSRLTAGGLTTVTRSGRHRYYRLSGHEVARALEALQALAPPRPVRSLRDARTGSALVLARSCYDHLAGELAIHIADGLTRRAVLARLTLERKAPCWTPRTHSSPSSASTFQCATPPADQWSAAVSTGANASPTSPATSARTS